MLEALEELGIAANVRRIGIPDAFVPHATQAEQRRELGLDEEGLAGRFRAHLARRGRVVPIAAPTRAAS